MSPHKAGLVEYEGENVTLKENVKSTSFKVYRRLETIKYKQSYIIGALGKYKPDRKNTGKKTMGDSCYLTGTTLHIKLKTKERNPIMSAFFSPLSLSLVNNVSKEYLSGSQHA